MGIRTISEPRRKTRVSPFSTNSSRRRCADRVGRWRLARAMGICGGPSGAIVLGEISKHVVLHDCAAPESVAVCVVGLPEAVRSATSGGRARGCDPFLVELEF